MKIKPSIKVIFKELLTAYLCPNDWYGEEGGQNPDQHHHSPAVPHGAQGAGVVRVDNYNKSEPNGLMI